MSMVLDVDAALQAPAIPQQGKGANADAAEALEDIAEALEDIIAAHRAALVDLAPHQERRRVRLETAWHITELGVLLRVRGAVHAASEQTQNPAPSGVRLPERGSESTGTDRGTH